MWRPEGWENPCPRHIHEHNHYEEGTDAMVEAFKKLVKKHAKSSKLVDILEIKKEE